MTKYNEASLFDLDQTLLTKNSSYSFGSYLYKKKIIPLSTMLYCVGWYSLHKVGKLSLKDIHEKIFKSLFFNKSQALFINLAKDFISDNVDKMIYSPAFQRLQEAKKKGHFTAILSSSPSFLIKLMAEKFEVCEFFGTEYQIDAQGKFISVGKVLDGEGKAHYLQNFSTHMNISSSNIAAYTDSFLDSPLLMEVGRPVGVNPDNKLRALCVKNHWEII